MNYDPLTICLSIAPPFADLFLHPRIPAMCMRVCLTLCASHLVALAVCSLNLSSRPDEHSAGIPADLTLLPNILTDSLLPVLVFFVPAVGGVARCLAACFTANLPIGWSDCDRRLPLAPV